MNPEEVQKAVYNALTSALGSPSIPVYDDIPEDEDPIYIVIGDDEQAADDTKPRFGVSHRIQIDIWSSYSGYKEVKETIAAIYSALHRQSISVAGHESTPLQFEISDYLDDPSGLKHGLIIFRLQTQPEI
jgi:hypothetical protein